MSSLKVMQVIDSLEAGGAERLAVNLANELAMRDVESHLCVTRGKGPLEGEVASAVHLLDLRRRHTADLRALFRLRKYIHWNRIDVLHAHSTSLFISALVRGNHAGLVWHDHYGAHGMAERNPWPYKAIRSRILAAVSVDPELRSWAVDRVGLEPARVFEIPNFIRASASQSPDYALPGEPGFRIVCVANFRPQKGHLDLIRAMEIVARSVPNARLLCLGRNLGGDHARLVREAIDLRQLTDHVSLLSPEGSVLPILAACDVGVLASHSEGFPLALLEYGWARLAVVTTDVGQCGRVVEGGRRGRLVPPGDVDALADSIVRLLRDGSERRRLGDALHQKVTTTYTADAVMEQLLSIYEHIST